MAASLGFPQGSFFDPDDEEDSGPGRVLSVEEFLERLRNRPDIFGMENSGRLRNTEILTLFIALLAGLWATSIRPATTLRSDFYDKGPHDNGTVVSVVSQGIERPSSQRSVKEPPPREIRGDKRSLRRAKTEAATVRSSVRNGGGNPFARITGQGVIGIISGQIKGKDVALGDPFSAGGFAAGIDAMIHGPSGLKQGGKSSAGRRGVEFVGYGTGLTSGFGTNGPGGVGDWYDGLMAGADPEINLAPTRAPPIQTRLVPKIDVKESSGMFSGGRGKMEIMRVVMQNLAALRYAYNQRLREKPGLKGKITVKFVIDERGNVLHCEILESSINDDVLETQVTTKILRWKFERIDKPGDLTEVVYPFVFST